MNLRQTKNSIVRKLERSNNEVLLKQIEALLDTNDDTVAGYEPDGKPYTYAELRADIADAEQEFEAGEGVTQEELRAQIKTWRKR